MVVINDTYHYLPDPGLRSYWWSLAKEDNIVGSRIDAAIFTSRVLSGHNGYSLRCLAIESNQGRDERKLTF